MHETKVNCLDFVRLEIESVRIVVLSDASLTNAAGLKNPLGFVVLMDGKYRHAKIVHYKSRCGHQIARSVMAAEVHVLVSAFHHGYIVCKAPEELLRQRVEIEALVDIRTLFNVIAETAALPNKGCRSMFGCRGRVISVGNWRAWDGFQGMKARLTY